MTSRPYVGIGVIIHNKKGHILLGIRKTEHGKGEWSLPGGHLEFFESFEECARREVFEETGLQIADPFPAWVSNDLFEESNKHYVTVFMVSEKYIGKVRNKEIDKCEGWKWFPVDNLPEPLYPALRQFAEEFYNGPKQGIISPYKP